jgi:hypothetical protein
MALQQLIALPRAITENFFISLFEVKGRKLADFRARFRSQMVPFVYAG